MKDKSKRDFKLSKVNFFFVSFKYIYFYNYFFITNLSDVYYFFKFSKSLQLLSTFLLIFSFNKNKMFVNLLNNTKKNLLAISPGLFIKFFEKKKSFKKNKTIKMLIAKYLRKIFIITKVKHSILIVKNTPIFLTEMLNFFNQPILHKFIDPLTFKMVEDKISVKPITFFLFHIFFENKNFNKNKTAGRGRIKRKILRKLVLENKLID